MAEPARWAGPKTRIVGEVTASEDLLVEGEIDGKVTLPAHRLVVAPTATLKADVFARAIRIAGAATGTFTASDKVEIEATARVEGRIVAPRVVLAEGATFNGRVEPHKADAAVRVAQYRMAQDDHPARPS
jgi:cytoskeletal protein CcmA (bactofilin family)